MACEEKLKLIQHYDHTTGLYSLAVKEMTRLMGMTPVDHYRDITGEAEAARDECERARLALAKHAEEHGC